jgi:hypothetical protein
MPAVEEGHRIERSRVSTNFKIELGRTDASTLAGRTDHVASLDLIAAPNLKLFRVSVSRYVVIGVAHENQIAEFLKAVASIDDDAIVSRRDWSSLRYGDCDPVVFVAVWLTTKPGYHFPMHRPVEDRSAVRGSSVG